MPTVRGFVQRIEVGRAGLVTVSLVHADGSAGQYVITDLDADPERFNERLSKLGVLRDAMNRAEPVEVEHVEGKAGAEIDRVARISRDALRPVSRLEAVTGLVLDVTVTAQNGVTGAGELHDVATVTILTTALGVRQTTLDLQAPERLVANAQLAMLHDAHAQGVLVRVMVDTGDGEVSTNRIVSVAVDTGGDLFGGEQARDVSGFVESLSLLPIPGGGGGSVGSFAHVRLTTAPPFTGAGNVVAMTAFTPETLDLLTPKGSLAYELFEAALRDVLRVRASIVLPRGRDSKDTASTKQPTGGPDATPTPAAAPVVRGMPGGATEAAPVAGTSSGIRPSGIVGASAAAANFGFAYGVELLAPLASASRPVWVAIERKQLDLGPEGDRCVLGSPSSDLTPRGMRDLRLPYPAKWCGTGCFNDGVYRFQLSIASGYTLTVDGKEICLHDADGQGGVKLGHACLCGGCHEVCVEIEAWTCDMDFVMDVYRLR